MEHCPEYLESTRELEDPEEVEVHTSTPEDEGRLETSGRTYRFRS